MTPSPRGDRGLRAAPGSAVHGAYTDRPNAAQVSKTQPNATTTRGNGGRYLATKAGSGTGGQPSELMEHVALAMTRYVRNLRQDGLQVPPSVDELASLLVRWVQMRPMTTHVDHIRTASSRAALPDQVTRRLLVTKAEAADLLGVSVRTVERLIAAGQLPLLHIERSSRLRLADIEAYVESLIMGQATPGGDGREPGS